MIERRLQSPNVSGLPFRLTRIIGREAVIDQLDLALDSRRLITVAGPGGIGKSTVAFAVAERRSSRGDCTVHFVDLSLCFDAASIDVQIANALRLDRAIGPDRAALVERLRHGKVLLLLDNCEHVVAEAALLAMLIANSAPNVKILATSREALDVAEERVHLLPGLPVPPRGRVRSPQEALDFPAVHLFSERATDAGYVFGLADVDPVIDICHRLDGIPLALELAASRIGLFGARELSARLDDRFELLTGGRRTAVPRHQTLLATLDWSYTTLSAAEQQVFACLSAFRGAFSLHAALDLLEILDLPEARRSHLVKALISKSMIVAFNGPQAGSYRLLESTRHYGLQRLADLPIRQDVWRAHARLCETFVAGARRDLLTLERPVWMAQYGSIVSDLQAALQWAFSVDGDRGVGLSLATAAAPLAEQLFLQRGYFEHIVGLARTDRDEEALRLTLPVVHMQLHVEGNLSQTSDSANLAAHRQEELGILLPEVVAAQFGIALLKGEYARALELARITDGLAAERREPELSTLAMRVSAQALYFLGRIAEAKQHALAVIASPYKFLPHTVNNHRVSMRVILARCAILENDFSAARGWMDEAVALGRTDDPITRCLALALGGVPVAVWLDDEALAREWLSEAEDVADQHALQFWRLKAADLARGLQYVWGLPPYPPEAPGLEDAIGPTNLDTLPTFAPALLTKRALERVDSGLVGWNAAEILRVHALSIAGQAPAQAMDCLNKSANIARKQKATFWGHRTMLTIKSMADRRNAAHCDAAS